MRFARPYLRTLRFKLTAMYLLVFGVLLTTVSITVLAIYETRIRANLDERLRERTLNAVESMEANGRADLSTALGNRVRPALKGLRFSKYYFQLRDRDGRLRERSANLGSVTLPFTTPESSSERKTGFFETIADEPAERLVGGPGEIRLYTSFHATPSLVPFCIQVGLSMAEVNTAVAELRRLLSLMVPVGLLAAGFASWLLARRSLAPIGKIARQAQALTAREIHRRIEPPEGQDEVAEMVRTINQMLDRLEQAFRAQERFIADAAHELKTPIAVVLASLQVLQRKERTPEELARFLAVLPEEMRRQAQTVDSLLTLARADAGLPIQSAMLFPVNDLVTEAVQRCEPLARQRGVRVVPRLTLPVGDEPEPAILGDAELLRSMLANLINNAIRHSPIDEIVEVEASLANGSAYVAVRDRGPGLEAEHLDKVFDRFYRVPRAGNPNEGTGLGLAIAKGVVGLHKGTIRVANRPGGGCEFTATLPLAERRAG